MNQNKKWDIPPILMSTNTIACSLQHFLEEFMEKLACRWSHRLSADALPKKMVLCSSLSHSAKTSSNGPFINLFYGFFALNEYAEKGIDGKGCKLFSKPMEFGISVMYMPASMRSC